jgi:Domain of unknown function (DUF4398)
MSSRIALVICAAALGYGLGGCASEGPPPTEALTRAKTLVDEADKAQGQRYAAADLQRAHDELSEAENANQQKHYNAARTLAESASADADVAVARADAGDAQRAARDAQQSNATLEQESQRAADAANAAVAGGMPPPSPSPPPASPPPMDNYPQAPPAQPDTNVPR